MKNLKHTKGKWRLVWHENSATGCIRSEMPEYEKIATIHPCDCDYQNGKLIAATPELLEALIEVRKHMTAHIPERIFDLVDNAIKKATE